MARPRKPVNNGTGTRAVVYYRVSKEDSDAKHGLDVQKEYCEEYVQRNSYSVVDTFTDDGISGTKGPEERPGLRSALELCEAGKVDVLVCYAADRISRSVGLFDQIRERLMKSHTRLETFKENQDFTRSESLLMGDIYSAFSAEERRRISARLYGGRRVRSRKDGLGSSYLPFGYVRDLGGHIVVDPVAARTINALFTLRVSGLSCVATAAALNEDGYKAPKGGIWTAGQVYWVDQHGELYRTGKRIWDGIEAAQQWPIVVGD